MELEVSKPDIFDAPDAVPHERVQGGIEFRNVTFAHDNVPVLTDVSFRVEPGKIILTRTGKLQSQMIFEEGVPHETLYQMSFGTMMMTVKATFVFFDLVEDGGSIDISYTLDIENAEAGVIDYHLDIRAK